MTWTFANGQTVTQSWSTTLTSSGASATARNVSYNGALAAGASTNFGFRVVDQLAVQDSCRYRAGVVQEPEEAEVGTRPGSRGEYQLRLPRLLEQHHQRGTDTVLHRELIHDAAGRDEVDRPAARGTSKSRRLDFVGDFFAFLAVAGGFAVVLVALWLLARRVRRRGIGGAVLGPIDEIYHPGRAPVPVRDPGAGAAAGPRALT